MSLNFKTQLYPPIERMSIDIEKPLTVSKRGGALKSRGLLRRTAVDLGLPPYRVNTLSNKSLEDYIKIKKVNI